MCLTLRVCLYVLVFVRVCVCTRTHKLHICPDSVGSSDWFWAQGLIALLQTQPGQNLRSQPLDTHKYTQTQSSREQCWLVLANVPPKHCWHMHCLYTHGAFFHRLSYQFNQEMNKQYFCVAVFVFDKWFIWWKVWSRPCPQYLFQAAADSSRSRAEYLWLAILLSIELCFNAGHSQNSVGLLLGVSVYVSRIYYHWLNFFCLL